MKNAESEFNPNYPILTLMLSAPWLLILCLFVFSGCDDGCEPNETRCEGSYAQVCDGDGEWSDVADCAEFEWSCCFSEDAGMHQCLKPEDCDERD